MRIVMVGAGEVGYHIANRLIREHHDIVVIDQDADRSAKVQEELEVMVCQGHGARPGTLEQAGIEQTDMLIAVTSSDEVNLVACLLARQYGVSTLVARVNDPDFRHSHLMQAGKQIGIDVMINPSQAVAEEILRLVKMPGAGEAADFLGGRVQLLSFLVFALPAAAPQAEKLFA